MISIYLLLDYIRLGYLSMWKMKLVSLKGDYVGIIILPF